VEAICFHLKIVDHFNIVFGLLVQLYQTHNRVKKYAQHSATEYQLIPFSRTDPLTDKFDFLNFHIVGVWL